MPPTPSSLTAPAPAPVRKLPSGRDELMLPSVTTPEILAKHLGWSARRVRNKARELGACRISGNRMVLTQSDVDAILEESRPCPLKSTNAAVFDITGAPLPNGDYAALRALRTKRTPPASRPRSKPSTGNIVSMVREQS